MGSDFDRPVVVVGAGLAGLGCAITLNKHGVPVVIIEASDGVGGRVRSDVVDGFILDRGFQVVLTAYPELSQFLTDDELDICEFETGALIQQSGTLHEFGDPFRSWRSTVPTMRSVLRASIATPRDLLRLAALRRNLTRGDAVDLLRGPDVPTLDALRVLGFSSSMIDHFFTPLVGGIQLDPTLSASSRMFQIILRMLFTGSAGVPSRGMGALTTSLANQLPAQAVHLNVAVQSVSPRKVRIDSGEIDAAAVVVATDGPHAAELLGTAPPTSRPASCVWFDAPEPPTDRRLIILDGESSGPVANVAVMSNVSKRYAPPGRHLIAAACPGVFDAEIENASRAQLAGWFGSDVESWRTLRVDAIKHGQPGQAPRFSPKKSVRVTEGLYVCGDHRDTASIQGALHSGRRCAEAVLRDAHA